MKKHHLPTVFDPLMIDIMLFQLIALLVLSLHYWINPDDLITIVIHIKGLDGAIITAF